MVPCISVLIIIIIIIIIYKFSNPSLLCNPISAYYCFQNFMEYFLSEAVRSPYMRMLQREFCPKGRGSAFMKCILV